MSAAWLDGSDDSGIFSDSDVDSHEDEAEMGMGAAAGTGFFFNDTESEDEQKRVIQTNKDKRFGELDKSVKKIKNSMKINDWSAISEEWAAVGKLLEKAKTVLLNSPLPSFYVRFCALLEDLIKETYSNKDLRKNMKQNNAKGLNTMKQQFTKYLERNEYEIRTALEAFRASGKTVHLGSDSESASASSTSSDEGPDPVSAPTSGGSNEVQAWTQERIDRKTKEILSKRGTKHYDKKDNLVVFRFLRSKCSGISNKLTMDFHLINALFDMTHSPNPMSAMLWKKVYNSLVTIIDELNSHPNLVLYESKEELVAAIGDDTTEKISDDVRSKVVIGHLMFSLERLGDEYYHALQNMEAPSEQYLNRLAFENPFLRLLQHAHNYYTSKNDVKRATAIAQRMLSFLYYRRGVDAEARAQFVAKGQKLAAELPPKPVLGELADPTLTKAPPRAAKKKPADDDSADSEEDQSGEDEAVLEAGEVDEDLYPPPAVSDDWDVVVQVPQLVSQVCKHASEDRSKRRAILQLVYHLALHDKFYEARDCLLMTHLQEKINKASFALQVLFNRAMVQLGIAAFRLGRIKDAHNCLSEIASGGKPRELLAQGVISRYQSEKSKEQEKQEYRRQIPYHMHINLDLIECVHLVTAMLLEVPNMAQSKNRDNKRKVVSKFFQKVVNYYDRQIFTGPPENTRESVIIAAKALERGDWKTCRDDLLNLPIWQLIPDNAAIKAMVSKEIQEQGIRTYLFSYGQYYDSLSLEELSSMFELEKNDVHAIVSKMIISEDLHASWDQPTGALIIHGRDPTPLQSLALNYAEKINVLSETSESLDQRNFTDRTRPKNKEDFGTSYGTSNTFSSNFNYARGQIGVTKDGRNPNPQRSGRAAAPIRTPAANTATSGGFVQRDKKGKARPVTDAAGFKTRK